MRGKIRSVGLTDVGRVREHNEDTIGVDADIGPVSYTHLTLPTILLV